MVLQKKATCLPFFINIIPVLELQASIFSTKDTLKSSNASTSTTNIATFKFSNAMVLLHSSNINRSYEAYLMAC